jgi:replicative DNA helicase
MTDEVRSAPHDLELEAAVLGSMLLETKRIEEARAIVSAGDFYKEQHRAIFGAIVEVGQADVFLVANYLKAQGKDIDLAELIVLKADEVYPQRVADYARKVKGLADRRRAANDGFGLVNAAHDLTSDEYLDRMRALGKGAVQGKLNNLSASDLMDLELPELQWTIPGVLPQGFTLLAGRPKLGKSFLAMNMALAIAQGGQVLGENVEAGDVLALCLEDGPRRLKDRLSSMLQSSPPPSTLDVAFEWPRLDAGGADQIEHWITEHKRPRLVIIDTLAKVRERPKNKGNLYLEDYGALEPLKRLADDHEISVLAVHHLNKSTSMRDPLDEISGSTGITGSPDTLMKLNRRHGDSQGELLVIGRDLEDVELAIDFDSEIATWQLLGPADEYRTTNERQEIIAVLRESGAPTSAKEIAQATGKNESTTRTLLRKMLTAGLVEQPAWGKYAARSEQPSIYPIDNIDNDNKAGGKDLF